ncbi:unnamed protein product, partial [marine sediment metagenome]
MRGHRVEVQAVEDILQTQFSEIEATALDYQNQELVAFVAAPSAKIQDNSQVVSAPPEWAARVTATLERQLPAPSVPTRIFLVDRFVMKSTSGKIDRDRLPDVALLLKNGPSPVDDAPRGVPPGESESADRCGGPPDADVGVDPDCEEILSICRDVFETPLGWDDVFVDNGGHSIVIARLAQRLQAAGWSVAVRALLSDCDTARKVASRPRQLQQPSVAILANANPEQRLAGHDEIAARVLSVNHFTLLQILFL